MISKFDDEARRGVYAERLDGVRVLLRWTTYLIAKNETISIGLERESVL